MLIANAFIWSVAFLFVFSIASSSTRVFKTFKFGSIVDSYRSIVDSYRSLFSSLAFLFSRSASIFVLSFSISLEHISISAVSCMISFIVYLYIIIIDAFNFILIVIDTLNRSFRASLRYIRRPYNPCTLRSQCHCTQDNRC